MNSVCNSTADGHNNISGEFVLYQMHAQMIVQDYVISPLGMGRLNLGAAAPNSLLHVIQASNSITVNILDKQIKCYFMQLCELYNVYIFFITLLTSN